MVYPYSLSLLDRLKAICNSKARLRGLRTVNQAEFPLHHFHGFGHVLDSLVISSARPIEE